MTVYFISVKGNSAAPVKIGRTNDLIKRLAGLQTGHHEALEVLASIAGGAETEAYLHEQLADHRLRGEWFSRSREVDAAIDLARKSGNSLPFREPANTPKRVQCSSATPGLAAKLCREIAEQLAPKGDISDKLKAVHHVFARLVPSATINRIKGLFYREAKRVDHHEVEALVVIRNRLSRLAENECSLRLTPAVLGALTQEASTEPTQRQSAVIASFIAKCHEEIEDDLTVLGLELREAA